MRAATTASYSLQTEDDWQQFLGPVHLQWRPEREYSPGANRQ